MGLAQLTLLGSPGGNVVGCSENVAKAQMFAADVDRMHRHLVDFTFRFLGLVNTDVGQSP